MTNLRNNTAESSDLTGEMTDFSVESQETDAATGNGETSWIMEDWKEHLGYYKTIPELQTAVDAKANWTMGAGFEAEPETTILLASIRGNKKDTFNTILENGIRVYTIGGDSFAEVIRDDDGVLVNLKPLDPSTIKVWQNSKGMIIRYEKIKKVGEKEIITKTFKPEEMFHLSRKRLADEIHGMSIIPAVKWIIDARNEAMNDWRRVMHRNIDPLWIFHLDTDDEVEIKSIKSKNDAARANGENMYYPKGVVEPEVVATAQNANMNPLAWINQLNDYFFQVVNVPQIIVGNAKEFTDASGKIVYLAYEQSVKGEQRYLEEQILLQLNLDIELTFPASLQNEAISDTPAMEVEEEPIEAAAQTNDMTSELEGKE